MEKSLMIPRTSNISQLNAKRQSIDSNIQMTEMLDLSDKDFFFFMLLLLFYCLFGFLSDKDF